ncbi:ROK family transcriptional regulator [Lentisphaera marina]|uniref:ROK family transcriptional regulator n=1 Tax=Lentisphaera marina TaxID=1111041 RepID=UPI0023656A14|nr:ROK family transcriptional regulator [Lentisphaera marina]MDD7986604.1 ROK family transcriptional regulator [Lentisphaera marina]
MRISDKKLVANAVRILNELHLGGPRTQVDLSKQTHLKRTSIFNLFEVMKNQGLVKVSDMITPAKGRPSVLWQVDGQGGEFLSVYFTQKGNRYSFYDFSGALLKERVEEACETMEECLLQLEEVCKKKSLLGIVLSVSGIVDGQSGEIVASTEWNLKSYPLLSKVREIPQLNDLLVVLENNARTALWGERVIGKAQGTRDLMSLFIESDKGKGLLGLGSALVLKGELYQGISGQAGELEQFYYGYLEKNNLSNIFELSEVQMNEFAIDLAEKFSKLVNYLVPQKVIVQFEGDVLADSFYTSFAREINMQKAFKYTSVEVLLSDHHEELIMSGAVHLLMDRYFDSSQQFISQLEKVCL